MPSDPYENHDAALPPPVREHLGQQLRSAYNAEAAKPDYLGDPSLPPEFTPQLRRLETRFKAHDTGREAVADALKDILSELPGKR